MTDLHAWITAKVDEVEHLLSLNEWPRDEATPVRLRCEADRRILARHRLDPDVTYEPACKGCGTYGDMGLSWTDNLNECPELLDLAHAHGLTPEILASLDQPQPPEPKRTGPRLGHWLNVPTRAADIPPVLRGPNWKADR
ncbi:hypothetical protein [Streptomyces sp. NPDC096153]|uniref:hypothetical protein n=1 Tax=Streptomyces sp. NPDC096153 TaxID=3155548 RepID=UPI003322C825